MISHIDVTASRLADRDRSRQAFHDSVTGLPGAALLEDRLEQALAEGARSGKLVAVALVDLHQHDAILQQHGATAADALLVQVADRLAACVRDGDTLAQLTGPRFVVVWCGVQSSGDADELTSRLRAAFAAPFVLAEATVEVTVTIGVALDEWAETGEELLLAAAAAVHHALRRGPGQLQVVQTAPDAVRPRTEAALREAMFRNELVVHYQPVVDLTRGVVVGVEALVRWQHPTDGLLGPDCFIPVAESGGLIVALGAHVLEQACAQTVRWNAEGLGLHVAVNLSMRQVAHPDLIRTVQRTLRSSGLRPSRLVLEVTESAVSEDAEAAATVLSELAALGVRLSVDDFGTGYSSLVSLKSYPVTALKIDRSFVAGMGACARDDAIVASVLALARAVGGSCIAEGVETPEQYASLLALGCDYGQGWLFGRAVPAHELPDLVVRCESTMAALRLGVVPIPEQARDRDLRDLEGDERDEVADRRDAVAERRDDAAQERDHAGDERDELGERRDRAGTRRDEAADLRDLVADERDRAADARDVVADHRDMLAEHGEENRGPETAGAADRSVRARRDAASDRARASEDRHAGAAERVQSERDRGTALADRGAGAGERDQAVLDRGTALSDRDASARERAEASVDGLTGAYQRSAGFLELQREIDRARRTRQTLVVAFVDVDGLKVVNDVRGHAAGDRVLVDVSRTLAGVLRTYDLVIRYGGDEFVCSMPGLSLPEAAERFALVDAALALAEGPPSVSVGLAELRPDETAQDLVARADADLYRRRGRPGR